MEVRKNNLRYWFSATIVHLGIFLSTTGFALADNPENKLGNWIGATSATRFSDSWSLFLQGELRTWEMASNLNELLFRVAGHYDFSPRIMGAFGYVRVDTWPFEENRGLRKFYENRLYEELLIKQGWGKAKVNHRFRLEQRWLKVEGETQYSNRARYMLQYTRPLSGESIQPGTNFVKLFNEVFIDFDRFGYWFTLQAGKKGLNQNRLYAGLGRQLTPASSLQLGVLWQHRPSADFFRLVLAYSFNFDLR